MPKRNAQIAGSPRADGAVRHSEHPNTLPREAAPINYGHDLIVSCG
jgi:hypothetical protein